MQSCSTPPVLPTLLPSPGTSWPGLYLLHPPPLFSAQLPRMLQADGASVCNHLVLGPDHLHYPGGVIPVDRQQLSLPCALECLVSAGQTTIARVRTEAARQLNRHPLLRESSSGAKTSLLRYSWEAGHEWMYISLINYIPIDWRTAILMQEPRLHPRTYRIIIL